MTPAFRAVISAQAMIPSMMAALMTGFFGVTNDAPTPGSLAPGAGLS